MLLESEKSLMNLSLFVDADIYFETNEISKKSDKKFSKIQY